MPGRVVLQDIMGLLSDPNRRRALTNLLTRLNTPIWYVFKFSLLTSVVNSKYEMNRVFSILTIDINS